MVSWEPKEIREAFFDLLLDLLLALADAEDRRERLELLLFLRDLFPFTTCRGATYMLECASTSMSSMLIDGGGPAHRRGSSVAVREGILAFSQFLGSATEVYKQKPAPLSNCNGSFCRSGEEEA